MAITDDFKGLPMESLIGAPLDASCKAQYNLAMTMLQFINSIGFDSSKTPATTRTLDFDLVRPIDDGTGELSTSTVSVNAPLLGLVPIPALLIESVNINFSMEVTYTTTSESSQDKSVDFDAKASYGFFSASVQGKLATHRENTRSTDKTAKYEVAVVARQQDPQEGMSKLMDLMASATDPIKIVYGSGS